MKIKIENVNIHSVNTFFKKEETWAMCRTEKVSETCLLSNVSRNQEQMHLLCSFGKEKDLIYLDHHPL